MLSSYIKQASGDAAPRDRPAQQQQQQPGTKYDAVTASRSILSSYLNIASDTGGTKRLMASDKSSGGRGGDLTAGHTSLTRGVGTGWRGLIGALDDDEYVNTAPVAGASNVRKSAFVIERATGDFDASSPGSVQSFRMPEPLYSPLTPTAYQPLHFHVGELDVSSATKPLSASIGMFRGSLASSDTQFGSKRVAFEPLLHVPPPQDSAIISATVQLQDRVHQLSKRCEDTEGAMLGLVQAHADEIIMIRAEGDMLATENTRLRLEGAQLQVRVSCSRFNGMCAKYGKRLHSTVTVSLRMLATHCSA
jgi:hypothetical protein